MKLTVILANVLKIFVQTMKMIDRQVISVRDNKLKHRTILSNDIGLPRDTAKYYIANSSNINNRYKILSV